MLLKAVKMGRSSQGSGTFLKPLCVCLNEGAVRGESRYLANPADKAAPVGITALFLPGDVLLHPFQPPTVKVSLRQTMTLLWVF